MTTMRISQLKERRIIHRPTSDFDHEGKRIYKVFEYDFTYDPSYPGSGRERLYAKIIDALPFIFIFFCLLKYPLFISVILSLPCILVAGTISEMYWGTTLGKRMFKINVIDDFGNFPGLWLSLKRNILCFINFCPEFADFIPPPNQTWQAESTELKFSMNLNNKICKTYIVKQSKIKEIRELLSQAKVTSKVL
ncbi:RDD family protein [Chryseobacterium pennipullorum]|uniref:RDD domain-containing protein n=1 Tax=Chryseobacterium pennipullorum TaxID=2258963 RepID=A0A3D9B926_9FLAO|nr:RDD family protein [Chryseobacterium pennipullorum]REC50180.1 hypothetical protein DRF67_01195 [Chryseobacterium pennipullorum]